jgi:hypothetical protein
VKLPASCRPSMRVFGTRLASIRPAARPWKHQWFSLHLFLTNPSRTRRTDTAVIAPPYLCSVNRHGKAMSAARQRATGRLNERRFLDDQQGRKTHQLGP